MCPVISRTVLVPHTALIPVFLLYVQHATRYRRFIGVEDFMVDATGSRNTSATASRVDSPAGRRRSLC